MSATLAATPSRPATALYALELLAVSTQDRSRCDAIVCEREPALTISPSPTDAEALQVVFDPAQVSYRSLIEYFYRMHDPTTANRQGPDTGSQYRSGIFYHSPEQKEIAEDVTKKANDQWYKGKIVTEVLEAGQWWDAESYHQEYLHHNPSGYECPSHFLRKFPELT